LRCVGDDFEPQRFSTWCPKVLAMIGKLPDTLQDRSILIELRRRLPNEKAEKLRDVQNISQLRQRSTRFAADNAKAIRQARPDIPEGLNDRAADNWVPLLAIADAAGGGWPKLAREAAKAISGAESEPASIGVELLTDIKLVFERKADRISSAELIDALCADQERPWATFHHGKNMTPRQLANRLRGFGIVSSAVRLDDGGNLKGYKLEQFAEAFQRYLLPIPGYTLPFQASQRHNPISTGNSGDFASVTKPPCDAYRKALKAPPNKACDAVTDGNPPSGRESIKAEV
jgi:hypothetical protein